MSYNLFLDDVRKAPYETWITVSSYIEFCEYITEHGVPLGISFDHDLGGKGRNPKTGYDCVKWLVGEDLDGRLSIEGMEWSVHSMNPVGARNIRKYLTNYIEAKYDEPITTD
jgi:hypothetical protein